MVKPARNPAGLPIEAFNGMRAGVLTDRSQFLKDLSRPFYGANRPNTKVSRAILDAFWLQGMQAGIPTPSMNRERLNRTQEVVGSIRSAPP